MKNYFINAVIWYILISLAITALWILTGIGGLIPFRLVLSLALAYYKPLYNAKS
jgi:hypothetical protein